MLQNGIATALAKECLDYMQQGTATSRPPTSYSTVVFPLYDAHGNMIATLARSGSSFTLGNQRSFDAWGAVRQGAATGAPMQRYCANLGHQQDDESGLIYMRARYYEPTTGRFISEDPGRNGSNWFIYAGDNPVSFNDASGTASGYAWAAFVLSMLAIVVGLFIDPLTGAEVGTAFAVMGLLLSDRGESKQAQAIEEIIGADLKVVAEEQASMTSPAALADEETMAGPAMLGIASELGQIEGELIADDLDEAGFNALWGLQ